ncbi:GlsB/YeaQ/YmgE family stress response membrane protein [Bosea sp. (in: a-proteobacteria)]|uniref:GlsB/YeaQ/YmgE family stress response membrane protein n=1 Tax=Bosea sp. (in: a-proteobacteria) TaxID=1871050 RepID=UPI0031FF1BC2
MSMPTVAQMIVWIVVGLIGGGLASRLITWDREGFGNFRNLGLGLVGALIGGVLFRWLNLLPGLDKVSISLRDIVAAVAGSLLVLAAIWLYRRYAK